MDQTETAIGHGQKFDVFLSHSGKQKNFVRQLYKDLKNHGVPCFFDQDRESLQVAEHFPSLTFEAIKTCKVAVLLITKDYLESKWPMLELSSFVQARDRSRTDPNLKFLPVYFNISPDALRDSNENYRKWRLLNISSETLNEWREALKKIRPIKGLYLAGGGDEVKFRDDIVKEIWRLLPSVSRRYDVRGMQAEARTCQEVAEFFYSVHPNEKGIRIAGLYGIAGQGKTTVGKAFCNFKLGEFEGKVLHLEFSRGDRFENIKLALQYFTHLPESHLQTLKSQDQAQVQFHTRVKGQRVLLVIDNITDKSIDEVESYLQADYGEDSWILLSARSVYVLEKHFQIDKQSCMRVPRLEEEEAIAILLQLPSHEVSKLVAEDSRFALKCAKRCFFKEIRCDNGTTAGTFHPLALKGFGRHLFSIYGSNFSKGADEIDRMVDRCDYGLDEVFAVLGNAFDDMPSKYRTIFMLLTVYMLPNMSFDKVIEWLAINCNEEISFIEKAVEDLHKGDFIAKIEPEIHIHDLYMEFAQSKAQEMGRWLRWKGKNHSTRGLIAQNKDGFELAKLEQCMYKGIAAKYLSNLSALQLIDVNNMNKIDLGPMGSLRSITICDCKDLAALEGMEKLVDLAWFQIRGVDPMLKLPDLSSLKELQYIEIDMASSQVPNQLGDLTHCFYLREIRVCCSSLLEFPRLKGLLFLEKVEFSLCSVVKGSLDCTDCAKLQTVVLNLCCQMAAPPLLSGCKKLSKLVLSECDIRDPPDLTGCDRLDDVYLNKLRNLVRFPKFSSLNELRKLSLCDCTSAQDPPDIEGCHQLRVFHLLYNDNMKGLPKMDNCAQLEEIHVSWQCEGEVSYEGIDPDSFQANKDLEFCLGHFSDQMFGNISDTRLPEELKESQWVRGEAMVVKRYFRGVKLFYSLAAPCKDEASKDYRESRITLKMTDGKVVPSPTRATDQEDSDWLNKVQEYFAANMDIACPSAASDTGDLQIASLVNSTSSSSDLGVAPSPTSNDYYGQYIQRFSIWASTFNWAALLPILEIYRWLLFNALNDYFQYIEPCAVLASTLSSGALVLILGSYGFFLSNPVFWLCWSILVMKAGIFNSRQPYWEWIEDFTRITDESQDTTDPQRLSDYGIAGAIILKAGMSIALLFLCSKGITQRQNEILLIVAALIIIFEGREGLSLRRNPWCNITQGQKWKALNFSNPSAINAMIIVTGPIALGGDLGLLIRKEAFHSLGFIFLVDSLAEFILQCDSGRRFPSVLPQDFSKLNYVAVILRLVVEGCLCFWMAKEIYLDSYFASDLSIDACNRLCRERSKQLLITMVALGSLQAAGAFITLCYRVRHHVHGPHDVLTTNIPLFVRPQSE